VIVVTGAAGFIGSALVWLLNQRGERDILCVDTRDSDGELANLAPLHYHSYLRHDAFLAMARAGRWPSPVRCVFHMGACSDTTETDWSYLESNNIEYSRELCRATLDAGARFVHASSAATYGDGSNGYSDAHDRLDALAPLNLYAHSKHLFDLWARDTGTLERIAVLKYFNVYGPNEWHKGEMRSMVCKGYEQIRDTGKVRLFKSDRPDLPDGGQSRDFVYVKDAADMTLWFNEHPDRHGIYNVGTGEANPWNRLIAAVFTALGREPNIEYFDMPPHLVGRYQTFTRAEMGKLRAAGYPTSPTRLEDAVADYVRNHLLTGKHLGE
jgi:ADP-L-glycero-D-manno-heptose 6-epimerase